MKKIALAFAALCLANALPADAAQNKKTAAVNCQVVVEDGWIRLLPGGMPMHAGFARIENRCDKQVEIVSATSPTYAEVELHQTTRVDGVSRMRQLEKLPVAAKAEALLQPGGLHLMLMRPQRQLQAGEPVSITFKLADGREISSQFEARQP